MRSALAGLRPSADFSFDNFGLRPKSSSRFGHGKTSHNPSRYTKERRKEAMSNIVEFPDGTLKRTLLEYGENEIAKEIDNLKPAEFQAIKDLTIQIAGKGKKIVHAYALAAVETIEGAYRELKNKRRKKLT
jgi:hypothetical protein